eukprot:769415-Pyramimonas_sp.AAC.1
MHARSGGPGPWALVPGKKARPQPLPLLRGDDGQPAHSERDALAAWTRHFAAIEAVPVVPMQDLDWRASVLPALPAEHVQDVHFDVGDAPKLAR